MSPLSSIRREAVLLAGLLIANIILRVLVAVRPLEFLDGLTISDDSYLALTIARNIARGLGPLYGLEHTNGFQPLYVFLVSPAFLIAPESYVVPIRWAMGILILFDSLTLVVLYSYLRRLCSSPLPPLLVAIIWIINPYVIGTTLNVLETAIAAFFITASISYAHFIMRQEQPAQHTYIILGLLLGCSILARIDSAFLALSVVSIMAWTKRNTKRLLQSVLPVILGISIPVIPWLAYSFAYTGLFYPVSGEAVRFNSLSDVGHVPTLANLYLPMMRRAAAVIVKNNWLPLTIIATATLWMLKAARTRRDVLASLKPLGPALLFGAVLVTVYTFYIFTHWYFDRYLYPISIVILLVLAVTLDRLLTRGIQHEIVRHRIASVLVLVIVLLTVTQSSFRELFTSTDTTSRGYMNVGLWARKHFPDGTRIGAQQSGAIGYFANNLQVINLDGVVNASCLRSLIERRNLDYIKGVGIEYIIGWPVDSAFVARHSMDFRRDDLERVQRIEGFRSGNADWYLWRVRSSEHPD